LSKHAAKHFIFTAATTSAKQIIDKHFSPKGSFCNLTDFNDTYYDLTVHATSKGDIDLEEKLQHKPT
jgi:hypothetical protein